MKTKRTTRRRRAPMKQVDPPPAQKSEMETVSPVGVRRAQYMIASRPSGGLQPLSMDFVTEQLAKSPDITFVKTIQPPRLLGVQSITAAPLPSLVLARMVTDKAELLKAQAGSRLTVERDPPLTFALDAGPSIARLPNPGILVPHANGFSVILDVVGSDGPLAGADVFIFGSVWPTQGQTDASGRAVLTVTGESPDTIAALYIKPRADHWSYYLARPQLVPDTASTITLKPLRAHLRDFPDRQLLGWGQQAMGLDRVPRSFDGAGVKIAIVDSGAAQATHRNLGAMGPGISIVGEDRAAWSADVIGHGSHCAGIISGGPLDRSGGVRGFAPAAEVHICRIFPGGRFSDLVGALDYCMEHEIDLVNMSLGGGEPSAIIEERIAQAKEMGIACIVAAGNSASPVQFPASSPHVLAVAALGKRGAFPEDSFHAQQVLDGAAADHEYFPAKFSCFGPEVGVCAPGVAIVSSIPPDGFGAWDGTSMATPHVTGLAALVLGHHPDFRDRFRGHDARRVERLFQILKDTATPLPFGDPARSGAGLPNAPKALGLDSRRPASTSATSEHSTADAGSLEALRRLMGLGGERRMSF